jgi:hypothetical protein
VRERLKRTGHPFPWKLWENDEGDQSGAQELKKTMKQDAKLENAYKAAEEKRRRAAITRDKDTIPMDFGAESKVEGLGLKVDETDPLWKQIWKTEGIRYLGREGSGVIDAMERFEHAFMLGYRAGVGDMLGEAQWLIKGK